MCMGGNRVIGVQGASYNPGGYQPDPRTYQYDNQGNPIPGTAAAAAAAGSAPASYATQLVGADTKGGITRPGRTALGSSILGG